MTDLNCLSLLGTVILHPDGSLGPLSSEVFSVGIPDTMEQDLSVPKYKPDKPNAQVSAFVDKERDAGKVMPFRPYLLDHTYHKCQVAVQGRWAFIAAGVVSYILEIRAAYLALIALAQQIRGRSILL